MGAEWAPNRCSYPWSSGTRGDTIGGVHLRRSWTCHMESSPSPTAAIRARAAPPVRASRFGSGPASDVPSWTRRSQPARTQAAAPSSPSGRARIANGLIEALGDARRGEPMTLRLGPQREVVRDAADGILALVLRLRDDRPVGIAGVAAAARLVDDRRGAMYRDDVGDLHEVIRSAQSALDATREPAGEFAAQAA